MFKNPDTTHLLQKDMNMAIDDTPIPATSMYMKKNYSYIVVGQSSTWQRGFTFSSEYDTINQLFMGATATVEADRGFYTAEFFAAAHVGWLDASVPPGQQPRVMTPRKFTREKDGFKLKFLLDPTTTPVFTYEMTLDPYKHPGLKVALTGTCKRDKKSKFKIPVACVAMVDEYNKEKNRTLDELRDKVRKTLNKKEQAKLNLDEAIRSYQAHSLTYKKEKAKKPSFGRGNRRQKFHDGLDKRLYKACFAAKDEVKKWTRRLAGLLKSLMFFTISLRPGEDPAVNPQEFIGLARHYHERWCIENGFGDSKRNFMARCRSRRPTTRTFYLLVSMMVYNRWQVARRRQAWFKNKYQLVGKRGGNEQGIPFRFKFEQQCPNLVTGVGFMVSTWRAAIMTLIGGKIKKCQKNH